MTDYKVSTVEIEDLYELSLKAVQRFVKGTNKKRLVRYFGSYYTLEDLAMEAVEKVIKAKPAYLTKSYINMAAKCACIDRLQQPKLPWQDVPAFKMCDEGESVPLEHLIEGDTYDSLADLEAHVLSHLDSEQMDTYEALQTDEMYTTLASQRNISTRTFERRVRKLKEVINSLLYPK